jgi:hypothetical protein
VGNQITIAKANQMWVKANLIAAPHPLPGFFSPVKTISSSKWIPLTERSSQSQSFEMQCNADWSG